MNIKFSEINLLEIGTTLQQWGAVFSDGKKLLLLPFPDETTEDLINLPVQGVEITLEEWERLLNQSDVVNVELPNKAIVRKSQRNIDGFMQWRVFERDNYRCRYCGKKNPLTVDHIDLWEDGGATVEDNLISACKRCNKLRGRMQYADWLSSTTYKQQSKNLDEKVKKQNLEVVQRLPKLVAMRVNKRSR